MTTEFAPNPLLPLITTLERSTLEIDRTFAAAGDRLGQGLAIFEALNGRLVAMSNDLLGSQMDGTRDVLLAVVGDLRAFSGGLSAETSGLQDIARHGHAASQSLDRLMDHIRLIAAVARSARIEAAQVGFNQQGGSFFDEIGSLVARARQTIETCALDHGRLTTLLSSAITSQRSFSSAYGSMLTTLADQLERTLGQIEDRRQKNVALTADAARQSSKIADAVGGAIMALQCGDSTRQRLEHALTALRTAREVATGNGKAEDMSDADRAGLETVLRRLVAVQLRDAAKTMAQDVREIDQMLRMLSGDIAATGALGRTLQGGGTFGADSFMAVLESELSQASALIGKCNAARAEVDGVTDALKIFVEQFRQTAVSLSDTVRNIVLIGMNSGLHASRLGNGGRGLVVIAHELKSVADHIVSDAAQLSPIFDLMQSSTAGLRSEGSSGTHRLAYLDETMQHSLSSMKDSGARLHATLDGLATDGRALSDMVEQACRSFAATCDAGDAIEAAATMLDDGTGTSPTIPHSADPAVIEAFLNQAVWPTYTMAAERTLHRTALKACGIPTAAGMSANPAQEDEADAMLAWA